MIVAGAGPWGLAAAAELAGAGHEVTVLDDGRRSAGHVAAGMLGAWSEWEPERPELAALLARAAAAWPSYAAELTAAGADPGYHRCGTVHVATGRNEIARLRHRLVAAPPGPRWLTASAARAMEAGLGPRVGGGIDLPDEHQVDPRRLLTALRHQASAAGARLVPVAAERLLVEDGRVAGAVDANGVAHDGRLILAGGWRASDLSPRVPLRGVKGQVIRLQIGPEEALPCTRVVRATDVYVVPRPSGEIVVGATMEERTDDAIQAGVVHRLLEDALRAVPALAEASLEEVAAGVRPATADGMPALGEDPDGVIWAAGGYRHGILLTPLVGGVIRRALAGEDAAPPGCDPRRFARSEVILS